MVLEAVSFYISAVSCAPTNIFTDGFFDAGMLLQALKKTDEEPETPAAQAQRKKSIGKRLALTEY